MDSDHPTQPLKTPTPRKTATLESIVGLTTRIEVMDIGAACITEAPVYRRLIDRDIAHLHAFDGDSRQILKIRETFGQRATVYPEFLYDGTPQTVHFANEASGMTSLLRPNLEALKFFNGFEQFGRILRTELIETYRLDDISGIPPIDFLKMDAQGAELTILKNSQMTIERCLAIQLEVSFIALYEGQPCFGEIDTWMRTNGFVPHCFLDVKRWSITPTVRDNNFRKPFNQLLEADVVYIRNPLRLASWESEQLRKLAIIAHDCFASFDLTMHLLIELDRRKNPQEDHDRLPNRYLSFLNPKK